MFDLIDFVILHSLFSLVTYIVYPFRDRNYQNGHCYNHCDRDSILRPFNLVLVYQFDPQNHKE